MDIFYFGNLLAIFWQYFPSQKSQIYFQKFEPVYETKYRNQPKNILKLFVTFAILSIAID